MIGVKLSDRMSSVSIRERLGISCISEVMRTGRLRWFGHVERMSVDNWVKRSVEMTVEGRPVVGRPRKTWREVLRGDLRSRGLDKEAVRDHAASRMAIRDQG